MSRQSKNAKKRAYALQFTALRKQGQKGPSSTGPVHGKRVTYRHNPVMMKNLAEFMKKNAPEGETVLDKINAGKNRTVKQTKTYSSDAA
jgi:hypothetical protein